jgi:4-amino-4-deoxy-L-arabinose transferase-like glycosyltransferase
VSDTLDSTSSTGNVRGVVALVFAVALTVRLATTWFVVGDDYAPVGDAGEYTQIARNLVEHGRFSIAGSDSSLQATARRSPLFPLLVAATFKTFGYTYFPIFFILAVLGALTCATLASLAERLFGTHAASVVGVLAAVYPGLWISSTTLMTETLYLWLLVMLVSCANRLTESSHAQRRWRSVQAGALLGLLALTRAEGLLVGLLFILWAILVLSHAERWRVIVYAGLMAALIVAPWVLRNFARFGAFVPGSTVGGFVLAGANNATVYDNPYGLGGWTANFVDEPVYRSCAAEYDTDEPEYTACLSREAVAYAIKRKDRWPAVVTWRLRRALDLWNPQQAAFFETLEGRFPVYTRAAAHAFFPILLLAIGGAVRLIGQARRLYWLYAIPVYYLLQISMTWGIQRMRAPMEPFLLLLAVGLFRGLSEPPARADSGPDARASP